MIPLQSIDELCKMAKHVVEQLSSRLKEPIIPLSFKRTFNLNTLSLRVKHDHIKDPSSESCFEQNVNNDDVPIS